MNIQSFAMPSAAYSNPLAYGDLTGLNLWTWILSHLFADQKFMSIFSVLFGAGIVLITEKKEFQTGSSAKLHYTRNGLLLLIGLLHAHLIWYGDILVAYALCSFLVYPLRKLSSRKLLITCQGRLPGGLECIHASVLPLIKSVSFMVPEEGEIASRKPGENCSDLTNTEA